MDNAFQYAVSICANLQNPLNKVLYQNAHILDICTILEGVLPSGHPHIIFLINHLFTSLGLHTSHYPALHNLKNTREDQYYIFVCKILKNEDENELFITFHEKHIS